MCDPGRTAVPYLLRGGGDTACPCMSRLVGAALRPVLYRRNITIGTTRAAEDIASYDHGERAVPSKRLQGFRTKDIGSHFGTGPVIPSKFEYARCGPSRWPRSVVDVASDMTVKLKLTTYE